jgi:Domain of unknown function (DUF1963)
MSVHDRIDLAHWIAEFPLSQMRAEARAFVLNRRQKLPEAYADDKQVEDHIQLMRPKWEIVVGPRDVAINEQLRTEALAAREYAGKRYPTDVVVWAKGEPSNRSVTKVGGLPYRPAALPWPEDSTGTPLRFIAQICFVDSRELVPPLPGDILLIFGDDDALVGEPERLVFEWWPLAPTSLISEVPVRADALTPFCAVLHRAEDWDDSIFEGTKIGGLPKFIQEVPEQSGAFIAALGSISVSADQPNPFVNVAEPYGRSDENDLMIGDMGSLYLFLAPEGNVQAISQCY